MLFINLLFKLFKSSPKLFINEKINNCYINYFCNSEKIYLESLPLQELNRFEVFAKLPNTEFIDRFDEIFNACASQTTHFLLSRQNNDGSQIPLKVLSIKLEIKKQKNNEYYLLFADGKFIYLDKTEIMIEHNTKQSPNLKTTVQEIIDFSYETVKDNSYWEEFPHNSKEEITMSIETTKGIQRLETSILKFENSVNHSTIMHHIKNLKQAILTLC